MPKQKTHRDVSEAVENSGESEPRSIDEIDLDSHRAVISADPQVGARNEVVDEAPERGCQAENLIRWQLSEWPPAWVAEHGGRWNHDDWLELLGALAESEFWPMSPEGIGRLLEEEAERLNLLAENLNRWRNSGHPEEWVKARRGEWNHDDWTGLLGELSDGEFWPMNPESVGRVLEEIKGSIQAADEAPHDEAVTQQAENLARWLDSGQPQRWVAERKGDWNHDDWTSLLGLLAESDLWPMEPEEIGRTLEEFKSSFVGDDAAEIDIVEVDGTLGEAVSEIGVAAETVPVDFDEPGPEPSGPPECDQGASIRLLVASGACVNAKDSLGLTPLHHAALSGDEDAVRLLLSNGADVHATTQGGRTPLHMAAAAHHPGIIALLVEHGAELNVADESGTTPLHLAIMDEELRDTGSPARAALASMPATEMRNDEVCVNGGLGFRPKNGSFGDELG